MAATYTAKNALDYAKRFIAGSPLDDVDIEVRILNQASNRMHMAANWHWTLGALTDATVINDQDDYTIATFPADFLQLAKSELWFADGTVEPLRIVGLLETNDNISGGPKRVSYFNDGSDKVRLFPTPTGYASGKEPVIVQTYKKKNTVLVSGSLTTATDLLFPDEWFWVFEEFVLYKAYDFTRDPRAGGVTYVKSPNGIQTQYTGKLGEALAGINEMLEIEKPLVGDQGGVIRG